MSKIKLESNPSGTGTFTIQSPASSTDRTLTLPDGAGELLTTTGDGSSLTGITTGKVLQVVSTTKTDPFVTTSTGYTDITGFNVSITPSSTSSKILVTAYITGVVQTSSGSYGGVMRLVRDSNDGIAVGDAYGNAQTATGTLGGQDNWPYQNSTTLQFLDSPSTTSSTTYKVQLKHTQGKNFRINYGIQRDGSSTYDVSTVSTITVMEIAG